VSVLLQVRAHRVARAAEQGYSRDRYRSWRSVAAALLRCGWNEAQAAQIMLSKIPRWAADASEARYGTVPAKVVTEYLARNPGVAQRMLQEVA
jgi:hypothetical protein